MPRDKSNTESHKVLLQRGRVSLLCWLCALSAGRFLLGAVHVYWSEKHHRDNQRKPCSSWFTFKSADMWWVHAVWDTDMRIFKQHTCRPSTSWQMWRSRSPALQCDVFLGYTEGLVVFMRRDETGLEHRMDHSKRQSRGRGGGRRQGDGGGHSFHVNIM